MTCNNASALPTELLEQISEQGLEYLPELFRILERLRGSADHVGKNEILQLAHYQLERGQLDAMWSYAGKPVLLLWLPI